MKKTALSKLIFLTCISAGLTSCIFDTNSELLLYIDSVKQRAFTRKIPPIPIMPKVQNYVFPEQDMRKSPFTSVPTNKNKDALAPDSHRMKQTLESYSLDALSFVGILQEGSTVWALMKTPGDVPHIIRIKTGDFMGKNFGRVMKITDKSVRLEELYQVEGRWKKQETTIMLHGTAF